MTNLIPEPVDGARVVVETGNDADPLRLYWRDDVEAKGRTDHADERWFDDIDSDPLGWDVVCRNSRKVFPVSEHPIQSCDAALVPLGSAPVTPCIKRMGHDDLHQTERGVRWADPADGEDD